MLPLPHGSCEQDQMLPFPVHPKPLPRWKPNIVEPAPNCPRCASSNTKFCYYNNYSLSQPRYFCKACRRYWTKGGFLRNVPVGGGSRKSRRSKTSRPPYNLHSHASSFFNGDHSVADDTSDHSNSNTDIDMALVFAKFLSGQDEVTNASSSSQSHCLTPESLEAENDAPQPSDPVADSSDALIPRDDRSRSTVESFGLMSGIEAAEWESLLGGEQEEVVQDVFWSDGTTSSSVTWQAPPLMQLQEDLEDPIPLNYEEDAQLPVTDAWSWNSFDFSSLQVFSQPP